MVGIIHKFLKNEESAGDSQEGQDPSEKDRSPRVQLLPLHRIEFQVDYPNTCNAVQIANLSDSGVGFIRGSACSWPAPGTILRGKFLVCGDEVQAAAKIVHISPMVVGCNFEGHTEQIHAMIEKHFKVELLAKEMRPVQLGKLKPHPSGDQYWYRGPDNCEVYFVEDEHGIIEFHVSLLGNYIHCNEGHQLIFGDVVEGHDESRPTPTGTANIRQIDGPPTGSVEAAMRFLENIPSLTPHQRSMLCSGLEKARSG